MSEKVRKPTESQRETLNAMRWNGTAYPMTTAEILSRRNRKARYPSSFGSVNGHLKSLVKKGLVEVVSEGMPRKWQATAEPSA